MSHPSSTVDKNTNFKIIIFSFTGSASLGFHKIHPKVLALKNIFFHLKLKFNTFSNMLTQTQRQREMWGKSACTYVRKAYNNIMFMPRAWKTSSSWLVLCFPSSPIFHFLPCFSITHSCPPLPLPTFLWAINPGFTHHVCSLAWGMLVGRQQSGWEVYS